MIRPASLRRLASWTGWGALAFVAFVTLSPIQDRPVIASIKIEHFGAYAVVGCLLTWAYPRKALTVLCMLAVAIVILEIGQHFVPGRHGRVIDAAVKSGGAIFGVVAGTMIDRRASSQRLS